MKQGQLIVGVVSVAVLVVVVAAVLPTYGPAAADDASTSGHNLSLLFVGDVMLDRGVALHARQVGNSALFGHIQSLFADHDLVVGNLEGSITTNPSIAQKDNSILRFTFDPHFAPLLASVGFGAVSLANNHALDFGKSGFDATRDYLTKAGIIAFGSPYNDSHSATMFYLQNATVCLVGYHALFDPNEKTIVEKITEIRPECTYIIVMTHWGEEYHHEPTVLQRALAHTFIDAGADVVVGAHPHVVQPVEIYNGKAIFYSLGNFLFDQGFSPQVKRGLAVNIVFAKDATKFVLTPVNTYTEVSPASKETADAMLKDVVSPELDPEITQAIITTSSFELKK